MLKDNGYASPHGVDNPNHENNTEIRVSDREFQVLDLIACGYTHAQAAGRLGISQHTVDTYVKRLRAKLGPGNKAHLVRMAHLVSTGGGKS
ncbi:helix-turn-helix transcriptional regulator [Streptomyces sp. NPDC059349]|uniref:helix-turn-helix domain-containing protein n=1 Tax=Streptomyces sp. NPDC059349 TaxID=3346808 RepID=UPI0036D02BAA